MREQAENLHVEDEAGWGGRRDRDLVEQAHAEDRILLTRDRRVVEIRRAGGRTIVLKCRALMPAPGSSHVTSPSNGHSIHSEPVNVLVLAQ
jgi:hypothetical protein